MTLRSLSLLLLLAFGLAACSESGTTTTPVAGDTVITMVRTGCFGDCPSYKVSILSQGEVIFEGRRFVRQTGVATGALTSTQLERLMDEFRRMNYFALRDSAEAQECTEMWTDASSVITSFTQNGRSATIDHYHGCVGKPAFEILTPLEDLVDEIANTDQWIE